MSLSPKGALSMQPKMSLYHAAAFLSCSTQNVHKQIKLRNIVCRKQGNKFYLTFAEAKQLFNISFQRKVIVSQIVKGGTGKTTTIENVASCANTYGARILKIDADPQGNLTDACGIDAEDKPVLIDVITGNAKLEEAIVPLSEGIDLIPSRIENVVLDNVIVNERYSLHSFYSDLLDSITDRYDFIFIDCPPTMGQAVTAASLYADIILVPLNPDKFSAKGLKILRQEVETLNKRFKMNISYRVFLNKSSNTILSNKAAISMISDPELEGRILESSVQFSQEIPNITDTNKNLFSNLKKKMATREDFDRLTRELLNILPNQAQKIADEAQQTINLQEQIQILG